MDYMKLTLRADSYKERLDDTQSMSEVSDIIDEIFDDKEFESNALAKMVLRKFVYAK